MLNHMANVSIVVENVKLRIQLSIYL